MTVREYREANNLTQTEFAEEINRNLNTKYSKEDVCKVESGKLDFPQMVYDYLLYGEKLVATYSAERNIDRWITIPVEEEIVSNRRFSEIYETVSRASKDNPATYPAMTNQTGLTGREIQRRISEMREMGVPIVSYTGHEGFWIAKDEQDMSVLVGMYEKQAKRSLQIANRLKGNCEGQLQWQEERG